MRKKVLTLVLGGALGFSSLAMAGELSSTDSNFLFKNNKAAAEAISSKEMRETQGKGQLLHLNVNGNKVLSGNGNKILSGNGNKIL